MEKGYHEGVYSGFGGKGISLVNPASVCEAKRIRYRGDSEGNKMGFAPRQNCRRKRGEPMHVKYPARMNLPNEVGKSIWWRKANGR